MAPNAKLSFHAYVFWIFCVTALLVGWFIPAFYDWTDSNQSRVAPVVGYTALGILVFAIAACVALLWLPAEQHASLPEHASKFRFNIRSILMVTTVLAVFMAILPKWLLFGISTAFLLGAWSYAVNCWKRFPAMRGRITSLAICMYLPFLWTLGLEHFPSNGIQTLALAIGLPMLWPTLLIGEMLKQNSDQVIWLCSLLTGVELLVGIWAIRYGQRSAIAYHLVVLVMSTFCSFVLNALMRM